MRRFLLLLAVSGLAQAAAAETPARTVVLGFDGVDAAIVEQMMAAGRLPNLTALKARGAWSPLTPTIPAQTPVSWSTFSTGLDPGGHEIFDFLKRNPEDRVPTFAVADETTVAFLFGRSNPIIFGAAAAAVFFVAAGILFFARRRPLLPILLGVIALAAGTGAFLSVRAWIPSERPSVRNNRKGATFWTEAGARPSTVIRMPVTFPPETWDGGRQLSGLGVPDISGRIGKPFYFTSDPFFATREGNDFSVDILKLESNRGTQTVRIAGPPAKAFGREGAIELPITLTVAEGRGRLEIAAGGERLRLKPGEWSAWVSLPFRVNPLVTVHGYGRFRLDKLDPEIALYLSPIQFDPQRLPPGFAISSPRGFATDLVRDFGRFKTMGWAIDTWSVQSGTLPEDAFLEDVAATVASDRRILGSLLTGRERLLVHYFEFTDRVAHVFWRFRDPQHPAYDAVLAKKYGDAVEKSYETVDAIVGDAAKSLRPEDVLIVLSDHGFASWRRSVNYNSWLVEAGYLVLSGGAKRKSLEALFSRGQFWEAVDWSRSKAYAMGLGDVYVNLKGRERGGIVAPGPEYEALRAELISRLTALTDPKNGERAVSRVFKREDIYRRFDPRVIPDLIVANTRGYRVSWQASLGVPTADVFEDNRDVWSGDHCSIDPDLVRGILFSSRKFQTSRIPGIADVTASVRALLGAPAPQDAAGVSLW